MKGSLSSEQLTKEAREKLSQQQYEPKTVINGVEFVDLPHFTDDGGSFIEVARLTNGSHDWFPSTEAAPASFSEMLPGVTKAFHLHFNQEDIWFIPPSSHMLVVLHDARQESETKGATMRFVMGAGKAKALRIPRGVAHGVRNIDSNSGFIFYFVSQQFDKENPDERRLPWDFLGSEIWETTKG